MAEEFVFRFMALRQSATKSPKDSPKRKRIDYSVTGAQPPLAEAVFKVPVAERTPELIKRMTAQFQSSPRYVGDTTLLPLDPAPLAAWVDEHAAQALKALDLPQFVKQTYDKTPAALAKSQEFVESADRLAETVFADAFGDANSERRRDDVVNAIKMLHLVAAAARTPDIFKSDEPLGAFVGRLLVTIPELATPQPEPAPPTVIPGRKPGDEDPTIKSTRARLEKLAAAHLELGDAIARPDALHAVKCEPPLPTTAGLASTARLEAVEANVARLALRMDNPDSEAIAALARTTAETPSAAAGVFESRPIVKLSDRVVESLSAETRSTLAELKLELSGNPFAAINTLEGRIAQLAARLPVETTSRKMLAFGGVMLDANVFQESYGFWTGAIDLGTFPLYQPCRMKVGIGDLLIVRQKLKAYELGDFAHVENVLRGESRSREHRRLDLREEITTAETEREVEKERNLQSTERNEMQNEASKTVQSQFQLDAGLQVSGSYGPAVSFSASLNTSFSTSTEEAQRKAVGYSREVTDKTSERIRERVREERRVRVLEQIEEINIHKIENTANPTGHVRGVYRWLNKIYDAQVFNYGQRLMYEFVVPEPAAYFLYAMVENPPKEIELEKPEPPKFGGMPLKPENLTLTNYQQYLAQYEVTTAKAPPSAFKNVAYFEKQEGKEESHYERASKVTIPDGYEATGVATNYWYVYSNDKAKFGILVGGHNATSGWVSFGTPYRDEISVAVYTLYNKAFAATVDIACRLTAEGFAKWQHETYAAIMEAYQNKKADYDDKLAQLAIQKGPQILGRNPLENLRLERDELKKLALMMLMHSSYLDINSYYAGAEPFMNISKACVNGAKIRFFENAFEWNNATWVFYPYFWSRHARWISALHLADPDPDFAAFLRAGAARLQVPVRPGFERAVAYYSQTGQIWEGNDVPLIGDDLYVPIVEEITENLGKLDEGVPYPPDSQPWEVTVPTSLVVVQDLEEIPAIRDILTGEPIQLLPVPADA